jgi:hypothetical protein
MRVFFIFVAIALAGCAPQTQYIRADGKYASPQSIEGALAECGSDSKDNLCMVEKGYFNVSAEQAEAKRAQLAAMAQADEQAAQAKAKELARQAKANELARQAKAKEKQRQAKRAAEGSKSTMKPALDEKKRKQTVNSSTSEGSLCPRLCLSRLPGDKRRDSERLLHVTW